MRLLRFILIGLSIIGLAVAGYLTYSALTLSDALCAPGGGCDTVRQSEYSKVAGVPVALIGLLGYLGILGVLLLEEPVEFFADNGPMLVFGMSLIGFIYSLYLTYLELYVIRAICPWCVASAVIMTLVFALALYRAIRIIKA
jgi:uncharacterized membrane protein